MGIYQPLFTLTVRHAYFTDGLWRGLDFLPDRATRKLLDNAGLLVRQTANGISVFHDGTQALQRYVQDSADGLRLSFKARARDRSFANYTAFGTNTDHASVLYFEGRQVPDSQGGKALSKEDFVSDRDLRQLDALLAEGILDEREMRVPPDFVFSIYLESATNGGFSASDYAIDFDARRSYWKYHLLGNMNRSNPFIVDLDNQVEFEYCGEVLLYENKPAKVFRSKELIPFLEKSNYRFQLREPGPGAGKVLIKRLPVASGSRLGMEMIDGRSVVVSESFVNY